jgi:hypothetical protein
MRVNRELRIFGVIGLSIALAAAATSAWDDLVEKRVATVVPRRVVRGAWQRPGPLRRLIAREKIKTIVTLTAINREDAKYVGQERVVRETGVKWIIIPMRGSRATLVQMAEAADLLADSRRQPVFFHCVAGHHRTSLVHAAYRIRHDGWSADRAWREVLSLPWTRPAGDLDDRRLIEKFAAAECIRNRSREDVDHAPTFDSAMGRPIDLGPLPDRGSVRGRQALDGKLRHRRPGPDLSLRPDAGQAARADGT